MLFIFACAFNSSGTWSRSTSCYSIAETGVDRFSNFSKAGGSHPYTTWNGVVLLVVWNEALYHNLATTTNRTKIWVAKKQSNADMSLRCNLIPPIVHWIGDGKPYFDWVSYLVNEITPPKNGLRISRLYLILLSGISNVVAPLLSQKFQPCL